MAKLYNVGIYTRLSIDDASNSKKKSNSLISADESTSIENQKLLLSKFAMLNGWIETKVYVDDGYSGGNFNRPGFRQLLEDVKAGIINLVLVKDLSRLGRDYIEVGRYTDVVFPSCGCRFVSLLDEIDTSKEDNDMMHFRSLMNDYHLKDLSNKIKASIHAKARNGRFLTGRPPYGYIRSEEDKHLLVEEPFAAEYVRKIFDLRLLGWGYGRIAGYLNQESVDSPKDYWDKRLGKPVEKQTLWMYATIRDLLRCETYIGNLLNFTERTLSHKDKYIQKNPEAEWLRHENAHEPIICQETWDKVQRMAAIAKEESRNHAPAQPSLFAKKLFCMDCGSPMVSHPLGRVQKDGVRRRTGTNYSCSRHSLSGQSGCSWHTISEKPLKALLLRELQGFAQAITLDENTLLESLKHRMSLDDTEQQDLLRREVKRLEQRLAELIGITADLYEDKVTGKISEATFTALMYKNEQERLRWQSVFDESQIKLTAIQEKILSVSKWAEVIRRYIHLEDICRADIEELIDHIEVGESDYSSGRRQQEIKIYWRFIGHIPA